jgi:hypothetical protein
MAGSRGGNGLESRSKSKWRCKLKSKEKKIPTSNSNLIPNY